MCWRLLSLFIQFVIFLVIGMMTFGQNLYILDITLWDSIFFKPVSASLLWHCHCSISGKRELPMSVSWQEKSSSSFGLRWHRREQHYLLLLGGGGSPLPPSLGYIRQEEIPETHHHVTSRTLRSLASLPSSFHLLDSSYF